MNYLKSLSGLLLFAFLAGCFGSQPPLPDPAKEGEPVRSSKEYEEIKKLDENRRDVLADSRKRFSGKACEEEDRDHDCKDQCRDIYTNRGDRDDCEELSVMQIERLERLYELLEKPDAEDLEDEVEPEDFDVYLNVSIAALDKLVGKYSSRKAEEFLIWMIDNEKIAKVFKDEDKDHGTLEALLKNLDSWSKDDEIYKPFIENLGRDTLMDIAVSNEEVADWFQDFINEENSDCEKDETDLECWTVYCKIGEKMDDDYRGDWLGFKDFKTYVNDIIEEYGCELPEGVNFVEYDARPEKCRWPKKDDDNDVKGLEDVRDVDDWVDDLCTDLL